MIDGTFFHPTFCPVSLPPFLQVFLEAESVVAAELSPEVVVLVVEPEVVFVAVVSTADVAEPQASGGIPVASDVLIPVFVVVVVDLGSSGHPKFFAFPNICSFPNSSSSVEVVG